MISRLFFMLLIIFNLNIYANPAPFGFELNKSTISEVEKLYVITKKETNYWQGYNYYLDIVDIKLEGLSELLIICNDNNIIQAVILTINNEKFTEFYKILAEKYNLVDSKNSNIGDKEIKFTDNDCTIILDAPYQSFTISLIYITDEFLAKFQSKQQQEYDLKKDQDKKLL